MFSGKESKLKRNWFLIASIIIFILFYGFVPAYRVDVALLIGGSILFGLSFSKILARWLRNESPKIVSDPIFSTTTGDSISAGRFVIYRMDAIRKPPITTELWTKGAIIYPRDGDNIIGMHRATPVKVEKVKKSELPSEVIKVIEQEKILPPYYFGMACEEDYKKRLEVTDGKNVMRPTVEHIISELKERNRENFRLRKQLNMDFTDIDQLIKKLSGFTEEPSKKGLMKRIFLQRD